MKKQIMAYITALTDVVGDGETINIYNSLKNLLDFVADLTEEVQVPENAEIIRLKKYVRELEDSCENMCQVQKHLQKKIDKLTGPKWVQD